MIWGWLGRLGIGDREPPKLLAIESKNSGIPTAVWPGAYAQNLIGTLPIREELYQNMTEDRPMGLALSLRIWEDKLDIEGMHRLNSTVNSKKADGVKKSEVASTWVRKWLKKN
jgi:hypothetical protein